MIKVKILEEKQKSKKFKSLISFIFTVRIFIFNYILEYFFNKRYDNGLRENSFDIFDSNIYSNSLVFVTGPLRYRYKIFPFPLRYRYSTVA
jgi:hypothetical protein